MKSLPGGGEAPYELNVNLFDALVAGVDLETALGRFLAAHAIAFSLAGIPGIYFHSLFGSRGDLEGAKTSGIPRRINRQKFPLDALEEAFSTGHITSAHPDMPDFVATPDQVADFESGRSPACPSRA